MNESLKVQPHHLERAAYLYVRQSSMRQVLENIESTQRQYALRGRATALGWREDQIVVVDTDQGESGASAAWREGFQRLVSEVGLGRAGIVMGLEVSRLARNNADWQRLLEICALTDTLILDEDGVYDPAGFNDRLLLGLKGTMSEAELHVLKARLRGGVLNKVRRGEYHCILPTGFVYDEAGSVALDPDSQIRETIEVCFPYFPSRAHEHVRTVLGPTRAPGSVLLSDGYAAYESYAKKLDLTHAQCWSHCRRELFEAEPIEPDRVREALQRIAALYAVEEDIRQHTLTGEAKQLHRLTHSKPLVEAFFEWVEQQLQDQGLLPSSPFTKALGYAHHRRAALQVFLTDPDVPVDTNHLERALRVVPMGRRNWLFCWTELGAEHVGIMQSLIVTCRLHGINPYNYLVDVLQRVGEHPASRVAELTPRLWKQRFAANPLRSALHTLAA